MDWIHMTDSRVQRFFLVKTAVTITENDYQYFGKDCCLYISIRDVVLMFFEHHK
jgi:hypothetical protein